MSSESERLTLRGIPPPPLPTLHDHERRLRAVESHVHGIREDVAFIRGRLEGPVGARSGGSSWPSSKSVGKLVGGVLGALGAMGAAYAAAQGWL